jgi:hypothetical protein
MAASAEQILKEIADDLFSIFESAETQSRAIELLLKEKGVASDEELKPFLQQAGDASSVKWRAARVRFDHLLSSVVKALEEGEKKMTAEPAEKKSEEHAEKPPKKELQKPAEAEEENVGRHPEEQKRETKPADKTEEPKAAKGESASQTANEKPGEQQNPAA